MKHSCRLLLVVIVLLPWVCTAQPSASNAQPTQNTESFWHKLLRITGIGASPSTLKSPDQGAGELWVVDLTSMKTQRLLAGDDYRSPLFFPNSSDILALHGTDVVRIPADKTVSVPLHTIAGIIKLVGFDAGDQDQVLFVKQGTSVPEVAFLSLRTGKITTLPYDPTSDAENHIVEYLLGSQRSYGDRQVFAAKIPKQAFDGLVEYVDSFLVIGDGKPENVSNCDRANCGQPALSPDGKRLLFVRMEQL